MNVSKMNKATMIISVLSILISLTAIAILIAKW